MSYHGKVVKSFVRDLPVSSGVQLPEVSAVRPIVNSVSFHRYGKEFAITITGENLWFCNEIKVGSHKQFINPDITTQKSLQFNIDKDFSGREDHISVKVWSHFTSPVMNPKTEVKHKVTVRDFDVVILCTIIP